MLRHTQVYSRRQNCFSNKWHLECATSKRVCSITTSNDWRTFQTATGTLIWKSELNWMSDTRKLPTTQ
eukprot:10428240-Prorocentrum_lima.AAC.1